MSGPSSSMRSQSDGVSTSGTPSSHAGSSARERSGQVEGLLGQDLGGLESRPSSASMSVPSSLPDVPEPANSGLKDTEDADVQVGLEIEFLVAMNECEEQGRATSE